MRFEGSVMGIPDHKAVHDPWEAATKHNEVLAMTGSGGSNTGPAFEYGSKVRACVAVSSLVLCERSVSESLLTFLGVKPVKW